MASDSAGYQITKRKKNGRELGPWQLRVFVPKALQPRVGKAEVWRTLKTTDRRLAERRAHQTLAEIESGWPQGVASAAPGESVPVDATDAASVAVRVAFEGMLQAMEASRRQWPADDAQYAARLAERDADLRRLTRRLQDGDLAQWEAIADRAIETRALDITRGGDEYEAFVRAIAEASIDAIGLFNRKHAGELDAQPRSAVVREAQAKEAGKARSGETLLELFDAWANEMLAKEAKRADTIAQDRKVIEQFAAFVGGDRDVRTIAPIEVADYRDTLRNLPPKWMSKRELRGLDMRSAAAKARELDLAKTAYTTINKHLSTISPLFKWLAKHPTWAGLQNPCDGLFFAKVKGKNARPPFSTADLNAILQSPLFTGFEADGAEHRRGEERADDWRFWIPIIAMFTGARIGEVAQLRVGDIRQERGEWFVHIRHEGGAGPSTKSGKSRPAAVHEKLKEIGLLRFHEQREAEAGGDVAAMLFPDLKPNARGQIGAVPSRWWRDYLAAIGVKDRNAAGGDGFGAHSFRHTIADRLRDEAELLDTEIAVCLGHSIGSTTAGYGRLTQGTVRKFKAWMDAVTFEGVKLDHLVSIGDARA